MVWIGKLNNKDRMFLKIFNDRSEYVNEKRKEVFFEGNISNDTKLRYSKIKDAFESGFLIKLIEGLKKTKDVDLIQGVNKDTIGCKRYYRGRTGFG